MTFLLAESVFRIRFKRVFGVINCFSYRVYLLIYCQFRVCTPLNEIGFRECIIYYYQNTSDNLFLENLIMNLNGKTFHSFNPCAVILKKWRFILQLRDN